MPPLTALLKTLDPALWPQWGQWPRLCAHCSRLFRPAAATQARPFPPQHLCLTCTPLLLAQTPRCFRCGLNGRTERPCACPIPGGWSRVVAGADHAPPWTHWIWGLKSGRTSASLNGLGPITDALVQAALRPHAVASAPWPDLLLPVPQTPARWRERGHNQARLLALAVGRRLQQPVLCAEIIQRRSEMQEHTHQTGLSREARWSNMAQGFSGPSAAIAQRHIAGRHVAVVDDVMTTGATAAALTARLLAAGAASVQIWVATRTLPPAAADEITARRTASPDQPPHPPRLPWP